MLPLGAAPGRAAGHQAGVELLRSIAAERLQAVELLAGGHQVAELLPLVLHRIKLLCLVDGWAWPARAVGAHRG